MDRALAWHGSPKSHRPVVCTDSPGYGNLGDLFIPKDGSLASYKEYISMLPGMDPPEAFGQHPNAGRGLPDHRHALLFETLLSLQPQVTHQGWRPESGEGKDRQSPGEGKQGGREVYTQRSCLGRSLSWLPM